jgi:pimeloyl-ACP methyl ester carboxylesterase
VITRFYLIILALFTSLFSCTSSGNEQINATSKDIESNDISIDSGIDKSVSLRDTLFYIKRNSHSMKIEIKVPSEIKGYLLFLHGWNLPATEVCTKSKFCQQFLDCGYVLIFPDFGKTSYQWENYPQTKKSYLKYPTRHWIQDTFLTHLQNQFGVLKEGERNFVFGVSTGGRGAALLALENPKIFKAAACLSADFDHSKLQDEPINNGFYGSIKLYPERWKGKDNIHNRANEFQTALFLAHGVKDNVCPVSQTVNFDAELKLKNTRITYKTIIDPLGDHTYNWWGKQILPVIDFFNQF